MAEGEDRYGYGNLTQSGIMRINSKDDKTIALQLNAFGGSTNFSIFTPGGGKPWSVTLKRRAIANILILLRNMIDDPKVCREPIDITTYDMETKRSKQIGTLAFGIDESMTFQIEIAGEGLNGRLFFPIRNDFSLNFSNTSMTEKDILRGAIQTMVDALSISTIVAERMTSFKRPAGNFGANKGGGQRGGYNNNSGGGGYNGGGNNNNRQGGSTFGGGGDVSDNDITF